MKLHFSIWITILCVANSQDFTFSDDPNVKALSPEQIADEELSLSINEFGYQLTKQLMRLNENKNVVISPAGVSGLLAMTLLGSVGESYQELAHVLGFSEDVNINRENHESFGELLRKLSSNDTSSKTVYADVIFADTSSKLREAFKVYLERVYGGKAMVADFRKQEEAKDLINRWVSDNTEGKIPNFLKQSLPMHTKAVLLSALYFKGQWKHPFLIEYTNSLPFDAPTEQVMVDQMLNMGSFPYCYSERYNLQMIALPYNDSVTTMYVLKPSRPKQLSLQSLLNNLDYKKIHALIDRMRTEKYVIRFPKMDLQKTENLEEPLKLLGVQSIFNPRSANFALMVDGKAVTNKTENELLSRINTGELVESRSLKEIVNSLPNPGVYVDTILHDVRITIDEYGTEAVAATSGILARSAQRFYADTPFYMFIRNERTKLVTFSAVIFNPKL